MAGRRSKLTPEVHQAIVAYARAGAFDWVAAEAAGISRATFYRWLQRGERSPYGPYGAFAQDLRQARAQARVAAETEVRQARPFQWLRYGPGRDRPGAPGWTERGDVEGGNGEPIRFTLELGTPRAPRPDTEAAG